MDDKSKARKETPIFSGVLMYFPLAIAEVARLSWTGNEKHNPGQRLHWNRPLSDDHMDCLLRHAMEYDQMDDDGHLHAAKVAWRALAQLQLLLEERNATLSEGIPSEDTTPEWVKNVNAMNLRAKAGA